MRKKCMPPANISETGVNLIVAVAADREGGGRRPAVRLRIVLRVRGDIAIKIATQVARGCRGQQLSAFQEPLVFRELREALLP
jgi:hypothetical protein